MYATSSLYVLAMLAKFVVTVLFSYVALEPSSLTLVIGVFEQPPQP